MYYATSAVYSKSIYFADNIINESKMCSLLAFKTNI